MAASEGESGGCQYRHRSHTQREEPVASKEETFPTTEMKLHGVCVGGLHGLHQDYWHRTIPDEADRQAWTF